jgi:hypothetical protein
MKATSQYMKHLLDYRKMKQEQVSILRNHRFNLQRMHDFGFEFRKEQEPLPAWAEALHDKLQHYVGGGVEAEHAATVG